MYRFFYKPCASWVGDIIPYFEDDVFFLYYLNERRMNGIPAEKTTWNLITTKDFFSFEEKGIILPTGSNQDADRSCYTGSVIIGKDGKYHMFYTAQNSVNPAFMQDGRPLQYIMHATGDNLICWEKDSDFLMEAHEGYDVFDWRDPFVFYDSEKERYMMLLAARRMGGSLRRSGCLALMESYNLVHWKSGGVFYAPGAYMTHECPDCFRMGDWWYLVFSTFSEKYTTHYCMSRTPEGPWSVPQNDTFDGRAFYGAKTAGNFEKRYLFGWIPTKLEGSDFGKWEWAGNLAVHQLHQEPDGTLSVEPPQILLKNFCVSLPLHPVGTSGDAVINHNEVQMDGANRYSFAMFELLPRCGYIRGSFSFSCRTVSFGLQLHADSSFDCGYFYRLEPLCQRVVFDMWPRSALMEPVIPNHFENDKPFDAGLERHIAMEPNVKFPFTLLIEEDICVLYIGRKAALTVRCCQFRSTLWGFFAHGGEVTVSDLMCYVPV